MTRMRDITPTATAPKGPLTTADKLTLARRLVSKLAPLPIETQREIATIAAVTHQGHALVLGQVLRLLRDVGGAERGDVIRATIAALGTEALAVPSVGDVVTVA